MPEREPDQDTIDEMTQSEELGNAGVRVDQQNVGPGMQRGGGEFPDPDTPPSGSAPGKTGHTRKGHGHGQFQEAYDAADPEVASVGSIKHEEEDEPPTS
jgi:hypothetical protein